VCCNLNKTFAVLSYQLFVLSSMSLRLFYTIAVETFWPQSTPVQTECIHNTPKFCLQQKWRWVYDYPFVSKTADFSYWILFFLCLFVVGKVHNKTTNNEYCHKILFGHDHCLIEVLIFMKILQQFFSPYNDQIEKKLFVEKEITTYL
jgi:hypothetical protein